MAGENGAGNAGWIGKFGYFVNSIFVMFSFDWVGSETTSGFFFFFFICHKNNGLFYLFCIFYNFHKNNGFSFCVTICIKLLDHLA
jgi:hypothetical protein